MNQNQVMGIARAVVPALVAYLVGKGYISASAAGDLGAAIITVLAATWSVASNVEAKPPVQK